MAIPNSTEFETVLSITLSVVVVYLRYWYHMEDHTERFPVVYKYVLFQYLQIKKKNLVKFPYFVVSIW